MNDATSVSARRSCSPWFHPPGRRKSPGTEPKGKLQHVVAFKFKEDASRSQIEAVEKAFADLPKKIKVIQHFEWGTNVSPENDKGFTHGFI
jgi:hypothetical protein